MSVRYFPPNHQGAHDKSSDLAEGPLAFHLDGNQNWHLVRWASFIKGRGTLTDRTHFHAWCSASGSNAEPRAVVVNEHMPNHGQVCGSCYGQSLAARQSAVTLPQIRLANKYPLPIAAPTHPDLAEIT